MYLREISVAVAEVIGAAPGLSVVLCDGIACTKFTSAPELGEDELFDLKLVEGWATRMDYDLGYYAGVIQSVSGRRCLDLCPECSATDNYVRVS